MATHWQKCPCATISGRKLPRWLPRTAGRSVCGSRHTWVDFFTPKCSPGDGPALCCKKWAWNWEYANAWSEIAYTKNGRVFRFIFCGLELLSTQSTEVLSQSNKAWWATIEAQIWNNPNKPPEIPQRIRCGSIAALWHPVGRNTSVWSAIPCSWLRNWNWTKRVDNIMLQKAMLVSKERIREFGNGTIKNWLDKVCTKSTECIPCTIWDFRETQNSDVGKNHWMLR